MHLSNFSMGTYNNCPNKFRLKYLDKVTRNTDVSNKYLSFDRNIHSAMKVLNTLSIKEFKESENLLTILEDVWLSSGYESNDEENLFKYKAFRILQYYGKNPKDIGVDNLLIDSSLKTRLPNNLTISSKIDKVYERIDSVLEVVDYKTGSNINCCLSFNRNIHLPIYLLLVYDKFNVYPKAISYYYLRYNKKST